jgi:hypothetical protein
MAFVTKDVYIQPTGFWGTSVSKLKFTHISFTESANQHHNIALPRWGNMANLSTAATSGTSGTTIVNHVAGNYTWIG